MIVKYGILGFQSTPKYGILDIKCMPKYDVFGFQYTANYGILDIKWSSSMVF